MRGTKNWCLALADEEKKEHAVVTGKPLSEGNVHTAHELLGGISVFICVSGREHPPSWHFLHLSLDRQDGGGVVAVVLVSITSITTLVSQRWAAR